MPTTPPTSPQRERHLRAITADGVFFSAMVDLGEAYVPAFALAVGLDEVALELGRNVASLVGLSPPAREANTRAGSG